MGDVPGPFHQTLTESESGLRSEAEDIKGQASQARAPEEGKNFLSSSHHKT